MPARVAWLLWTHSGGWRVASNKGGLADLKRLAREAQARADEQAARPTPKQSVNATGAKSGRGGVISSGSTPASTPASAQDLALFRRVAGNVAPVDTRNRLLHTPQTALPPVKPAPSRNADNAQRDTTAPRADAGVSDADVSHLLCADGTAFLRPGVGPDVLLKIAQRFWRLDADLDLHGMTIEQARPRLAAFITQCVAFDARCIRVVHGKGYGSPDATPILRDKVRAWLVGLADVRAFAQAPDRDGGAGATIVLLRADERRARDRRDVATR